MLRTLPATRHCHTWEFPMDLALQLSIASPSRACLSCVLRAPPASLVGWGARALRSVCSSSGRRCQKTQHPGAPGALEPESPAASGEGQCLGRVLRAPTCAGSRAKEAVTKAEASPLTPDCLNLSSEGKEVPERHGGAVATRRHCSCVGCSRTPDPRRQAGRGLAKGRDGVPLPTSSGPSPKRRGATSDGMKIRKCVLFLLLSVETTNFHQEKIKGT